MLSKRATVALSIAGVTTGGNEAVRIGGYKTMFPGLPPLDISDARLSVLAEEMVKPTAASENADLPAGYTYFGQFIAHDLTRMRGGQNVCVPTLSLDNIYGHPVEDWPHIYEQDQAGDRAFILGHGAYLDGSPSPELDLPRGTTGTPAIPDDRDDFHVIIAQLHLGFMLLHNRLTRDLRRRSPRESREWVFSAARQELRRLYQWLAVDDFLPRLCDPSILAQVWPAPRQMKPAFRRAATQHGPAISYEFALAGYRFGHGMVRPGYRLNHTLPIRPIFHPHGAADWMADWRGHRKLPVHWSVQWDMLLAFADSRPQRACCFSTSISPSLGELPQFTIADDVQRQAIVNLAERTLRAGRSAGLPSGQELARHIAQNTFPKMDLQPFPVIDPDQHDPLWYYVLKEASAAGKGMRLGPVGSWIVATTLAGTLIGDDSSFLHAPDWMPALPVESERFQLCDLVRYSGMPVSREDWRRYVSGELLQRP